MTFSVDGIGVWRRFVPGRRSQSEVMGTVLIMGLVIIGALIVVGLGATALGDTETQLTEDRAEKALTQLDSTASLVALGEAESQQVGLPNDGDNYNVDPDAGWLRIEVENRTAGPDPAWGQPLVDVRLGTITYAEDGNNVAYQGGGVFKQTESGGTVISPPEFHYRGGTLTLPIVNITGGSDISGSSRVSAGERRTVFPDSVSSSVNPLQEKQVVVTVQSQFYRGWGEYFEQRTEGEVTYDDANNQVRIVLKTPIGEQTVDRAIFASSGAGDFEIAGGGGSASRTDSYNSSNGAYSVSSAGNRGNITVGGDLVMSGNSEIKGNVRAGGQIDCKGSSTLDGVAYHAGGIKNGKCLTKGETPISGVDTLDPITGYVQEAVTDIKADNNNGFSGADVTSQHLVFPSGTATLPSGSYYLDDLTVSSSEELVLDTSGGLVEIAVEKYVDIVAADITIQGDGEVNVYVNGSSHSNTHDFRFDNSGSDISTVDTPGAAETADQFWIYGKDDMTAVVGGSGGGQSSELVGVIFAPSGLSGSSQVDVDAGEVFGGVIAGTVSVANGGAVHYDQALSDKQALPEDTKIISVTYLHITENTITFD